MASTFNEADLPLTATLQPTARLLGIKYNDGGLCVSNGGSIGN